MSDHRRICPECGAHQRDPSRAICDVCEARLGTAEDGNLDDLLLAVDRALMARSALDERHAQALGATAVAQYELTLQMRLEAQRKALRVLLLPGEHDLTPAERERAREALARVERVLGEMR